MVVALQPDWVHFVSQMARHGFNIIGTEHTNNAFALYNGNEVIVDYHKPSNSVEIYRPFSEGQDYTTLPDLPAPTYIHAAYGESERGKNDFHLLKGLIAEWGKRTVKAGEIETGERLYIGRGAAGFTHKFVEPEKDVTDKRYLGTRHYSSSSIPYHKGKEWIEAEEFPILPIALDKAEEVLALDIHLENLQHVGPERALELFTGMPLGRWFFTTYKTSPHTRVFANDNRLGLRIDTPNAEDMVSGVLYGMDIYERFLEGYKPYPPTMTE